MRNKTWYILWLIVVSSCVGTEPPIEQIVNHYDVIVLNEGNFRSGNASVNLYNSSSGEVLENVFQNNNQGRPLGDVAQSMIQHDGKGYIVVNNSNKIEVIDLNNFKSVGSITGLNSPRYILPVGRNKAYVSDLYQDEIYVIDLVSLAILKKIPSAGWIEEMTMSSGKAFVCHVDSNQVWVFDVQKDTVIQKINTGIEPNSIVTDLNGNVWVACSGGFGVGKPTLIQINPINYQKMKVFEIDDLNKSMSSLALNPFMNEVFFLSTDVFKLSIDDTVLTSTPFIRANNRIFRSLGIHPSSGDIYILDAIDYQQLGVAYRYDYLGVEMANFSVGLIPGYIHFNL
ncbi:MAG: hypothetical protein DWP98_03220 [Bacteroidetes bacterium]|nr:MAG: hypothetical protein DWP98_03220 [Bacteroidota bacterium]MBL1145417.1 hypothetical protein [Bacteroidota bacterium]NOG58215.1 hypothetical protein [Bacteroidota bacterium]